MLDILFCIYLLLFGFLIESKKLFWYNKEKNNDKQKILLNYCFVFAIIIPIFLSIYYSYTSDFQPQGRYIMPMLVPFSYFVVYGIQTIIEKIMNLKKVRDLKHIKTIKNIVIILIVVIIVLICIYCLTNVVIPYFKN